MIEFRKIQLKNFNSFESLEFPIMPGRHLVLGLNKSSGSASSNGSGKSSVFESIPWTLFKRSNRDKDPSRNYAGDCMTSVELGVGVNSYRIERYCGHPTRGNEIQVFINGENVSHRKAASNEEEVRKIIGISADLFVSSIVVAQGLPINFTQLTPTLRKTLVEDMLGFSVWDGMRKIFSSSMNQVGLKRNHLDFEFTSQKEKMISLNSRLEVTKKIQEEAQKDLESEKTKFENRLEEIIQKLEHLLARQKEVLGERDYTDLLSTMDSYRTSLQLMKNKSREINTIINDRVCPTCTQPYPSSRVDSAVEESKMLQNKVSRLAAGLQTFDETKRHYESINSEFLSFNSEKKSTQRSLEEIKQKILGKSEADNLNCSELNSELQELVESVNALSRAIQEIDQEISHIKYLDGLMLPSSRFRTSVLSKYISHVNKIISEISPYIFDDVKIQLLVDGKGTGIDIEIFRKEKEISYKSLSGGEKKRIDIVLILSFQRFLIESSGISTNLIVFDEIFDSLDKFGIERVLHCIDNIFPDSKSIYVISHNQDLKNAFHSVVWIKKENDISSLQEVAVEQA